MLLQSITQRLQDAEPKQWPIKVVDAGLAAVLFVAPLFWGGRHDLGLLVYGAIVLVTAIAWAVDRAVREELPGDLCPWTAVLLIAAPALLLLQLTPLPGALIGWASPGLAQRLVAWDGAQQSFGVWNTLTVDPWSTRASLAVLATHCVLFLVVAQRMRTVGDVRRVVTWVGWAAIGMSALALLQYASGTKQLLWCVPLPFRDVSRAAVGSFTTPNHCGHFIALGAGAVLLMVLRQRESLRHAARQQAKGAVRRGMTREDLLRTVGTLSALLATGAAVLMTFSRGALLAYLLGLVVTLALLTWAGWVGRAHLFRAVLLIVVCGVALSFVQYEQTAASSGGVTLTEIEDIADTTDRQAIWGANVVAFAANPLFGYGGGTHRQVYPAFIDAPTRNDFTHAESGYLQIATESGLAGLLLLAVAVGLAVSWCVRGLLRDGGREERALWAVIAAAMCVSLFHSIADFVWFIPSCVAPVAMLAAGAMRLHRLGVCGGATRRRPGVINGGYVGVGYVGVGLAAAAAALLIAPAQTALTRDHYDMTSVAVNQYNSSLFAKAQREEEDADQRILASRIYYADTMIHDLLEVVNRTPNDAAAQLRLATQCLLRFELAQAQSGGIGLDGVRAAVAGSEFPTREAVVAWLRRAFGDDANLLLTAQAAAANAVRLCPMQGIGYLYLADLDFLAASGALPKERLVDQSLQLRPQDGAVLFLAGKHRYEAQRWEEMFSLWKHAGQAQGGHLVKLASAVSAVFPAERFVAEFDPDWRFTLAAYEFYRRRGEETDLRVLADHTTHLAQQHEATELPGRAALNYWQAATIHEQLGDLPQAVACATRAFEICPQRLHIRRGLASALYRSERFDEADPHIRWCLARRPDDQTLRHWLKQIAKQRLTNYDAPRMARLAGGGTASDGEAGRPPEPEQDR